MTEYTPEKVAELITEAREKGRNNISKGITLNDRLADALTAVTAERDTAIRDLDAGFAESDHLSAKYYQRMRDAEREMHARELHHFEEEQISADLRAERDSLHKAITEALDWRDEAYHGAFGVEDFAQGYGYARRSIARILRAALDKEGNDDE